MSQGADTTVAPGPAGTFPARPDLRRLVAGGRGWLRSNLFLRTASGRVGWRKILLALAAVLAGAAVSLSRTGGPGALNTIWIEDAKFLLNQALNSSFLACLRAPISGYYQEPARIFTEIAIQFPLTWAPGVMSAFAALEYALYGLVAYTASGPHLRSPWLRLLVAAPTCMIPLAYTQANNDLVTVQFFGLYGAFWTLLWIPGTRAGRILSPLVMLSVSSTASLSIVFAPLVLARLLADRSKNALFLVAFWAAGVLLQMSQTLLGKSRHYLYGFNGPWFVLRNYVTRAVPRALFGESALGGPGANYRGELAPLHIVSMTGHIALIAAAWVVVVAALMLALTRFTDPDWPLAVTAGMFSVGIFFDELLVNTPVVQPRYVIAPALLLYVVLVAVLRPREWQGSGAGLAWRWLPVAWVATLIAIALVLNFRVSNGRTTSPPWTSVVAHARTACAQPGVTAYTYTHEWWQLKIPCTRLGTTAKGN
jgi:hypothetical protein